MNKKSLTAAIQLFTAVVEDKWASTRETVPFAHAQADLNICEAHMFEGIFSHVAGQTDFEGQKDWFGIHIPEGYGKNALLSFDMDTFMWWAPIKLWKY